MLQHKVRGCKNCSESSSCEFSSEFCPKPILTNNADHDIAADPAFKKYQEFYQRLKN